VHNTGHIHPAAARMALYRITAQFTGGMNLPRASRHVERGVHRYGKYVDHQREEYHA
jgi:hypothetical protein